MALTIKTPVLTPIPEFFVILHNVSTTHNIDNAQGKIENGIIKIKNMLHRAHNA